MTAVYTNKAPGGVAYACSFRITEAVYLVERMVDCLAYELEMDPAELRLQELHPARAVPVHDARPAGSTTPATTSRRCAWRCEIAGYDELRREQAEKRARGELMGIGVAFFTEAVGAGPRKDMDILGLGMADGCRAAGAPDRQGRASGCRVQTQGQGHETTFAQIVAEELGIPPDDIEVVTATPTRRRSASAPTAAGRRRSPAPRPRWSPARCATRRGSSPPAMLEVSADDLEWEKGRFHVKGDPTQVGDHPGDRHARARRR